MTERATLPGSQLARALIEAIQTAGGREIAVLVAGKDRRLYPVQGLWVAGGVEGEQFALVLDLTTDGEVNDLLLVDDEEEN
jgi:hypothetical protein